MNEIRILLWTICAEIGFVRTATVERLLLLGRQQFKLAYGAGGKVIASGTISGESVSFSVPPSFDPKELASLSLAAWRTIREMTDAELEDFVAEEESDTVSIVMNLTP